MFEKFPLILLKSKIKIKKNRRDCEVLLGRGANSNFCQVLVPVHIMYIIRTYIRKFFWTKIEKNTLCSSKILDVETKNNAKTS